MPATPVAADSPRIPETESAEFEKDQFAPQLVTSSGNNHPIGPPSETAPQIAYPNEPATPLVEESIGEEPRQFTLVPVYGDVDSAGVHFQTDLILSGVAENDLSNSQQPQDVGVASECRATPVIQDPAATSYDIPSGGSGAIDNASHDASSSDEPAGGDSTPASSNGDSGLPTETSPETPPTYRPRLDRHRTPRSGSPMNVGTPPPSTNPASLDAELAIAFQPGEWGIELSVLLHRGQDMPEKMAVRLGQEDCDLYAIDDELFEPIELRDARAALEVGIITASRTSPPVNWRRSGRDLHVFTTHTGVTGFVSASRVVIGHENALLCRSELADSVIRVSRKVGVEPRQVFGPGIPEGWSCFRGIHPNSAVAPTEGGGVLLALVPLPDARIELDGGLQLKRSAWLSGYPPSIRIVGANPLPDDIRIDSEIASASEDGCWTASGWDRIGSHTIWCGGISRSYSIDEVPDSWDRWDGHSGNGLVVCGALTTGKTGHPVFASGEGPTWVIGRSAGEIVTAVPSNTSAIAVATPAFEPTWAVAACMGGRQPSQFPRLIGPSAVPLGPMPATPKNAVRQWCQVIRDHGRSRRLQPEKEAKTIELWAAYRQSARAARRRLR